jgi:hypothetical protein
VSIPRDLKTGSSDPADFAKTRNPIRIFFVHIVETVSQLPMFTDSFLRELPKRYYIEFLGGLARLATVECKLQFVCWCIAEIYVQYDGPKSMIGIRIPVRLDPDLIGHARILERTMTVHSQLESKLYQNPNTVKKNGLPQ